VLGIINLCRLEVALLRRQQATRPGGVIANFGSVGSWYGGPSWVYYGATKWAISGFTEGLAAEVKDGTCV
jgi:NAD(P)-dependent dehydrogenase (short-subunit alcohol dehydrogenase family)